MDRQIEDDRQIDYIYVYIYVYTYTRVYSRLYFLLQEKIRYKLLGREREKKKREKYSALTIYVESRIFTQRNTHRIETKSDVLSKILTISEYTLGSMISPTLNHGGVSS